MVCIDLDRRPEHPHDDRQGRAGQRHGRATLRDQADDTKTQIGINQSINQSIDLCALTRAA